MASPAGQQPHGPSTPHQQLRQATTSSPTPGYRLHPSPGSFSAVAPLTSTGLHGSSALPPQSLPTPRPRASLLSPTSPNSLVVYFPAPFCTSGKHGSSSQPCLPVQPPGAASSNRGTPIHDHLFGRGPSPGARTQKSLEDGSLTSRANGFSRSPSLRGCTVFDHPRFRLNPAERRDPLGAWGYPPNPTLSVSITGRP